MASSRSLVDTKDTVETAAVLETNLLHALDANLARVIDLWRDFDTDSDGKIDRKEFTHGLQELGFDDHSEAITAIFDAIDGNSDGSIEFRELERAIKEQRFLAAAREQEDQANFAQLNGYLRTRLGGSLLVSGDAAALERAMAEERQQSGRAGPSVETAAERVRHEPDQAEAALTVQTLQRGRKARARPPERVWVFHTMHAAELVAGGEDAAFHVRANEKLELLSCTGSGRLVLEATDARSGVPDRQTELVVWDSQLHDLAMRATAATLPQLPALLQPVVHGAPPPLPPPPAKPLLVLAGGQQYAFSAANAPGAALSVRFRLEVTWKERDLSSEPLRDLSSEPAPAHASPISPQPSPRAVHASPRPTRVRLEAPGESEVTPSRPPCHEDLRNVSPTNATSPVGRRGSAIGSRRSSLVSSSSRLLQPTAASSQQSWAAKLAARAQELDDEQYRGGEQRDAAAMTVVSARSGRQKSVAASMTPKPVFSPAVGGIDVNTRQWQGTHGIYTPFSPGGGMPSAGVLAPPALAMPFAPVQPAAAQSPSRAPPRRTRLAG